MSRVIRLTLYFVVGLLLGTTAVLAHADTVPANSVPMYTVQGVEAYKSPTALEACEKFAAAAGFHTPMIQDGWCTPMNPGNNMLYWTQIQNTTAYVCPSGYAGPSTIGGVPNMCETASCPAGQEWDSVLNGCAEKCEGYTTRLEGTATCICNLSSLNGMAGERPWFEGTEKTIPEFLCNGGCKRQLGFGLNSGSGWAAEGGAYTGERCSEGEALSPEKPTIPKKKPPCAVAEGVMTSTSGTVACVPEGLPGAKPPKVEKKTKTETFPDDSQKKTEETKTTDTQTGATSTSTTVTVTAGGGGGTMAGTPGSSSGSADETEECEGEDCGQCDPKKEMCSDPAFDGMYEKKDKTVGDVLNGFSSGMQSTPIGEAFTGVFDIQTPAGTCPNLSANIPYLNTSIDLAPYICSATAIQYLEAMGTILKVVVGYIAITWILF